MLLKAAPTNCCTRVIPKSLLISSRKLRNYARFIRLERFASLQVVKSSSVADTTNFRDEFASIAGQLGYKIALGDKDEEQETWDDAMEELEDPWMKNPAPSESLEHFADSSTSQVNFTAQDDTDASPSSSSSRNHMAAAGANPARRTQGEVTHVTQAEVDELLRKAPIFSQRELANASAASMPTKKDFVIVLDVRNPEDIIDSAKLPFVNAWNVPLADLSKHVATLSAARTVVVLGVEEGLLAAQACIRLTKVFGIQNVWYLENWI